MSISGSPLPTLTILTFSFPPFFFFIPQAYPVMAQGKPQLPCETFLKHMGFSFSQTLLPTV